MTKSTYLPKTLSSTPTTNDVGDNVHHLFDRKTITAINAAIAINRPLLIWGETGIGKSQLAKAVAQELNRVFIPYVCDGHTESKDLLWHFDAVARLAEAQVQGSLSDVERQKRYEKTKGDPLGIKNYIVPQALWWAFNWKSADGMPIKTAPLYVEPCHPQNGAVVLIDEIDKTSSDVPNGLLEALGNRRFQPQGLDVVEVDKEAVSPLLIVTTNGERNLPDAFIRRCLSLRLSFPETEDEQRVFLSERGRMNFPELASVVVEDKELKKSVSLLELAADFLIKDRKEAKANQLYPLCGQAEYFDMLRGIKNLSEQDQGKPEELLHELRLYTYQKLGG